MQRAVASALIQQAQSQRMTFDRLAPAFRGSLHWADRNLHPTVQGRLVRVRADLTGVHTIRLFSEIRGDDNLGTPAPS
jgi:hypothetical protein